MIHWMSGKRHVSPVPLGRASERRWCPMDTITEFLKLATALVLLAIAVLKFRSTSKADGSDDQEDE